MHFKYLPHLTMTLMVPSVYSCLQYSSTEWCDQRYLQGATITDNGQEVCWFDGYLASDSLYHYTCFQGNYAALQGNCDGVVRYANPWGNFEFQASSTPAGPDRMWNWQASEYGC